MLQDPLNDAMATIRNAEAAGKAECFIRPASKLIGHVLKVMEEHQYIRSFELVEDGRGNLYRVGLVGSINNCGVIKPRFAVRRTDLEKFEALGLTDVNEGILTYFDNVFSDHSIDIRTGELLGRYIAEEHDTSRLVGGCYGVLCERRSRGGAAAALARLPRNLAAAPGRRPGPD